MNKLTFKIERPTDKYLSDFGLSQTFSHAYCDIKRNGKVVGSIQYHGDVGIGRFKVGLMIADPAEKCGWKWIFLTKSFDAIGDNANITAAKEWVKTYWEQINAKYNLRESD